MHAKCQLLCLQSDLMRMLPASGKAEVNAVKRVESKTFLWIMLGANPLSEAFVTAIGQLRTV